MQKTKGYSGLLLLAVGGLVVHKLVTHKWLWESLAGKRTALSAGRYLNMKRLSAPRPRPAAPPKPGVGDSRTVYTPHDPSGEIVSIINR